MSTSTIAPSAKTALIAGATGLVGSHLLQRLLADARYGRVIAVGRKPLDVSHVKLETLQIDFDRLESELRGIAAEEWFCTLGTTIKQAGSQEAFRLVDYEYPLALARFAASSGAEQMLAVTAMGASANSRIFYSRVKGELERDMAALKLPKLHLFRPSLLLGKRRDFRLGERIGAVVMTGIGPLMARPLHKYRGIQADTVAQGMIAAAHRACGPGVHIYDSGEIAAMAAAGRSSDTGSR